MRGRAAAHSPVHGAKEDRDSASARSRTEAARAAGAARATRHDSIYCQQARHRACDLQYRCGRRRNRDGALSRRKRDPLGRRTHKRPGPMDIRADRVVGSRHRLAGRWQLFLVASQPGRRYSDLFETVTRSDSPQRSSRGRQHGRAAPAAHTAASAGLPKSMSSSALSKARRRRTPTLRRIRRSARPSVTGNSICRSRWSSVTPKRSP